MLLYIAYLKKGEQRMEGILHVRPTNYDPKKYEQSIKLKIQDLYNKGSNTKVIVYTMFKKRYDMQLISQTTGFTINEIWDTINEIDPLMYIDRKDEHDRIDQFNNHGKGR